MAANSPRPAATRAKARKPDAIALLKADHRQVEEWFSQFEKTNSRSKKQKLAFKICEALTIHTTMEEEIFYPAFIEAFTMRPSSSMRARKHSLPRFKLCRRTMTTSMQESPCCPR
jgi:hypothetical protein